MSHRTPPLKSLEVFLAAARRLSFGKAGEAMGLSASAVSRRIKGLEEDLGITLFLRRGRSVSLTEAGARYAEALGPAFEAIGQASRDLVREERRPLVVAGPQSFAVNWLMPRLSDFRAREPDVDLRVEVSADITGDHLDGFDLGIFLARGRWPGRHVERLMPITVFPVCAPALAERLRQPGDLAGETLLHVRQLPGAWPEWLRAAGVPDLEPRDTMQFNDVQLAYEAAMSGLGVAVGADIVVADALRDGRLVAPIDRPVVSAFAYHLVCARARLRDSSVRRFRNWLRRQAWTDVLH